MINCPFCDERITVRARFCPQCGINVHNTDYCAVCGAEFEPNAKFCIRCGAEKPKDELPNIFESADNCWNPFDVSDPLFNSSDNLFDAFNAVANDPFAETESAENAEQPFDLSEFDGDSAESDYEEDTEPSWLDKLIAEAENSALENGESDPS